MHLSYLNKFKYDFFQRTLYYVKARKAYQLTIKFHDISSVVFEKKKHQKNRKVIYDFLFLIYDSGFVIIIKPELLLRYMMQLNCYHNEMKKTDLLNICKIYVCVLYQ